MMTEFFTLPQTSAFLQKRPQALRVPDRLFLVCHFLVSDLLRQNIKLSLK